MQNVLAVPGSSATKSAQQNNQAEKKTFSVKKYKNKTNITEYNNTLVVDITKIEDTIKFSNIIHRKGPPWSDASKTSINF